MVRVVVVNPNAAEKRVSVASLDHRQLKQLAEQVREPEQRQKLVTYLEGRERAAAQKRKGRRRSQKAARRKNRR